MRRSTPSARVTVEDFGPRRAVVQAERIKSRSLRVLTHPIALMLLGIVIFSVYLPGIDIPYYGDDFGWIDTTTGALTHFIQVNADGWYRPLQASVFTLVQRHFGLNTIPLHLLSILIHTLLCWLVLKSMIRLGYAPTQALFAALFLALSQANAFAVLSDDTLSQVAGTFFGCLSVWGLLSRRVEPGAPKPRLILPYAVSLGAFALALLSKETTASFLPILVCALLFLNYEATSRWASIRKVFFQSIPFVMVFFIYFLVRFLVGANSPSLGSGGYNFRLGTNALFNAMLDLFALVVPVSTVRAFEAFQTGDILSIAVIAVGSLLFFSAVVAGLWIGRADAKIAAAIVFLIGSAFPMVLMNHVSELYVYNSMPFFAVLVGIGIGTLLEISRRQYIKHAIAASFALFLVSHVAAIQEKAILMRENGQRAAALVGGIATYIHRVPPKGELLLVNPPTKEIEYAVYVLPGFRVLEFGESFIKKTYGREDISLRIIEEAELKSTPVRPDTVILGLEGDTLKPLALPATKGEPYGVRNG